MQVEGEVKHVKKYFQFTSSQTIGVPIQFGPRGQAVSLLGVHVSVYGWVLNANQELVIALSTNPEHELAPPLTAFLQFADPATYGFIALTDAILGAAGGELFQTIYVPLYGIVRPSRQVLSIIYLHNQNPAIVAEYWYRMVQLDQAELNALNTKYGKYRRT